MKHPILIKLISAIENGVSVAIVFSCLSYFKLTMDATAEYAKHWWSLPLYVLFGTIFYLFAKKLWVNFNKEE